MLSPAQTLAQALLVLPPAAIAGKGSDYEVTKTFKFKDDVFLEFKDLPTAIGPDSVDVLMTALNGGFAATFQKVWIDEIEAGLLGGDCVVDKMRPPKFSMCEWKYPEKYDVDELPTPGQCYKYQDQFVQRFYYNIDKLEITCPENFYFKDLDKEAYTEAAFSGPAFLNVLSPPGQSCDGDASACLFADATAVDWVEGYDVCTAEMFINRFMDVPVYLKCLDTDGYGRKVANKLIKALDQYFETAVIPVLEEQIYDQAPESFVYNFASPYDSDRKYCAHGAYYAGGNLRDQVVDADGVLITKFTYSFDVIWYKPMDCHKELLPDVEDIINGVFAEGNFLLFLQGEYPQYDFIQDIDYCDVIVCPDVTFPPTEEPTSEPTEGPLCDLDTNEGCDEGQVCRLSCVWATSEPQCFDDEEERDCTGKYGPGWVCRDSDGDGIISGEDHSNGCEYRAPTSSPTRPPTVPPSDSPTLSPTLSPTTTPTGLPTLDPVTNAPTERVATPFPTENPVTDAPTREPTGYPTTNPTLFPSPNPTSGSTTTIGQDRTSIPTLDIVRPADTHTPTFDTPRPTCPMCIVYPDDKEEDECPIVTIGTCGDGKRGDGICPFAGHCCSKWGYCGTTPLYCDDESVAPSPSHVEGAPQSPTYAEDAGQCAAGEVGDGFCTDESLCCSDWGYCGSGENYCFHTKQYDEGPEEEYGTCGGGGTGDGVCRPGLCCSKYGFCGTGDLYCTGHIPCTSDKEELTCEEEAQIIVDNNPLPEELKPETGYRCGFSEVDARSNCKRKCTHHVQCSEGEECWGVQLNYCNTFEEGTHPVCTNLDMANGDSRCGVDEASARGHCGAKCNGNDECNDGEYCFPTLLNLCECHEDEETCPTECAITFSRAKELITPYFVESENSVEGRPRSVAIKLQSSIALSLLIFASTYVWL